jgi:hypothetical protein
MPVFDPTRLGTEGIEFAARREELPPDFRARHAIELAKRSQYSQKDAFKPSSQWSTSQTAGLAE